MDHIASFGLLDVTDTPLSAWTAGCYIFLFPLQGLVAMFMSLFHLCILIESKTDQATGFLFIAHLMHIILALPLQCTQEQSCSVSLSKSFPPVDTKGPMLII